MGHEGGCEEVAAGLEMHMTGYELCLLGVMQ